MEAARWSRIRVAPDFRLTATVEWIVEALGGFLLMRTERRGLTYLLLPNTVILVFTSLFVACATIRADTTTPPFTREVTPISSEQEEQVVRSIDVSPDGKYLALAGDLGVFVYTTQGFEQAWATSENSPIYSAKFSPAEDILAIASFDAIVLQDITAHYNLAEFNAQFGPNNGIAWSPSGALLATGIASADAATIDLWDVNKRIQVDKLEGGNRFTVSSLVWSSDGKRLASGSSFEGKIIVWNLETGDKHYLQNEGVSVVGGLGWSPDGNLLASGSIFDSRYGGGLHSIIVWDAATSAEEKTADVTGQSIASVKWSPDGDIVASGTYDGTIILWNVKTGDQLPMLDMQKKGMVYVTWSPNGDRIYSALSDGAVTVWNSKTGEMTKEFHIDREGHQ